MQARDASHAPSMSIPFLWAKYIALSPSLAMTSIFSPSFVTNVTEIVSGKCDKWSSWQSGIDGALNIKVLFAHVENLDEVGIEKAEEQLLKLRRCFSVRSCKFLTGTFSNVFDNLWISLNEYCIVIWIENLKKNDLLSFNSFAKNPWKFN